MSVSSRWALIYTLYYLIIFCYCRTKDLRFNPRSQTISRYYNLFPSLVVTVNIFYLFLCSLSGRLTSLDRAYNCVHPFFKLRDFLHTKQTSSSSSSSSHAKCCKVLQNCASEIVLKLSHIFSNVILNNKADNTSLSLSIRLIVNLWWTYPGYLTLYTPS